MRGVDMSSMSVWATVVVAVAVVAVIAVIIAAIVMLARGGKRKDRDGDEPDGDRVEVKTVYESERRRGGRDVVVETTVETESPAGARPPERKAPERAETAYPADPRAEKKARKKLEKARKAAARAQKATEEAMEARQAASGAGNAEPCETPAVSYDVPAGEAYEAARPLYEAASAPEPVAAEESTGVKTVKTLLISRNRKTGLWDVNVEGEDTPVQSFQTETEALTYSKRLTGGRDVRIVVEKKRPEAR